MDGRREKIERCNARRMYLISSQEASMKIPRHFEERPLKFLKNSIEEFAKVLEGNHCHILKASSANRFGSLFCETSWHLPL